MNIRFRSLISGWAGMSLMLLAASAAEPDQAAAPRVGVYDSRAVAFAHFWSDAGAKPRNELMAQAKAAKAAGDTARFGELSQAIRDLQARDHLEVFSTAPAAEAMAALQDRLPALQQALGVARFVSKWDEAALEGIPEANRVDVTDRLVRELLPVVTEKQQKTITQLVAAKPLPLEQAKKLAQDGKL